MPSKTSKILVPKSSDFGERLKAAFQNSTNQSIAEKIGVSKPALTAYMQGRVPPAGKLVEISKITNCNLHWLLTGEGSRKVSHGIERPQGIIVQGSKGGIGATTVALFIAVTLALKGYGVLYADDWMQMGAKFVYCQDNPINSLFQKIKKNTDLAKLPVNQTIDDYNSDYFLPTGNSKLDLFFPRNWVERSPSEEKIQHFRFNSDELLERYQFIIFDTELNENPFYYGTKIPRVFNTEQVLQNFLLEPILRNAKIIVPFDVVQSRIDNVRRTFEYVDKQKKVYPEAGIAGIVLNEQSAVRKGLKNTYDSKLNEVKENFGSKIYKSAISHHPQLQELHPEKRKLLFSRKTSIHKEFSNLTDEILEKI